MMKLKCVGSAASYSSRYVCLLVCLQVGSDSAHLMPKYCDIHGFALHKSAFRDALSLRYNWPIQNKLSFCSCGHTFSIDHALSCSTGGFPSIRHNEVRDITASLLSEACHNEPHLQPLTGEVMTLRSANTECNSRLNVALMVFGGVDLKEHYLMYPCARSNRQATLQATYRRHEQEKKREYDQRVRAVEHSTFTPLVLSVSGGMGRSATTVYKRLAGMICEKKGTPCSKTIGCKLSFSLLRSTIMAIRGARSSIKHGALCEPISFQSAERRLQTTEV